MSRPRITCDACGRTAPHAGHGYCNGCYLRWLRAGKPAGGVPKPARPDTPQCGTRAAYQRHQRLGEVIDPACSAAHRIYMRAYMRNWRASGPADIGARDAEIRRVAAIGLTEQQVADETGCVLATVQRVLAATP